VKTLLAAVAALAIVACGDTASAPDATPQDSSPTASAAATAKASPAPVRAAVVTLLNAPLTVARSHFATLQARTAPNAQCSVEVDYASGPSTAAGLADKTSNSAGAVSWTWKVGANTTRGAWPITVTCGSATTSTHITVT
jgi:hypothetical protein